MQQGQPMEEISSMFSDVHDWSQLPALTPGGDTDLWHRFIRSPPTGMHSPQINVTLDQEATNSQFMASLGTLQANEETAPAATVPSSLPPATASPCTSNVASEMEEASSATTRRPATSANLPDSAALVAAPGGNPFSLLVEASLELDTTATASTSAKTADAISTPSHSTQSQASDVAELDSEHVGLASKAYFWSMQKTPPVESRPDILSLLSMEQIKEMFDFFFEHLHVHSPCLDQAHSSPEEVLKRSPLLFTLICCIAGRYRRDCPQIHHAAAYIARKELQVFPTKKSLETVQFYLLGLAWSSSQPDYFDQETVWLRSGIAARMALELGFHRTASMNVNVLPQWRVDSMRRTWCVATRQAFLCL
jgi:hypothetical protein